MQNTPPPEIFNRYEILRPLGKGGMGEVYCVFDRILGRTVAMKIIKFSPKFTAKLQRFTEEAQVSARLQHPNILPIYDLGQLQDGRFYFTMKIVQGESLTRCIQKLHADSTPNHWGAEGEPYSLKRLLRALKQVGDAVSYAHNKGIIHRDLKPLNIMLEDHGSVQLIDWGVAKTLNSYFLKWSQEITAHLHRESPTNQPFNENIPESSEESTQVTLNASELYSHSLINLSPYHSPIIQFTTSPPSISVTVDHHITSNEAIPQETLPNSSPQSLYSKDHTLKEYHDYDVYQLNQFTVNSIDLINHEYHNKTKSVESEIAGTINYMAPEQLLGDVHLITPSTDVFGLGAVLYKILTNHSPFKLDTVQSKSTTAIHIKKALELRKKNIQWPTETPPIPSELKELCENSLAFDPTLRPVSAADFTQQLIDYLDGVGRREKGLLKVQEAEKLFQKSQILYGEAQHTKEKGDVLVAQLSPTDPEHIKFPAWELLDLATQLIEEAQQTDHKAERTLYDALLFDHKLLEAHTLLAERAMKAHRQAELASQYMEAHRQEMIIRNHVEFASPTVAKSINHYLSPTAPITILVDVSTYVKVEVYAQRYVKRGRRLHLAAAEFWGVAPLNHYEVLLGSYLLTIKAQGYEICKYPIWVEREKGWSNKAPDRNQVEAIQMIPQGMLPLNFSYVPSGWFYTGGDPLVSNNIDQRCRLWVDGFILGIKHVTHREYLVFLNQLITEGKRELAYHLRPRLRDEEGEGIYSFQDEKITLIETNFARLDWPANYVDYEGALAYCHWRGEQDRLPYRLPSDMEWEKVARGVDGRTFPWGDYFDTSFTHMRLSQEYPQPGPAVAWDIDQSPWGHFALAGSMRDWTSTIFQDPFPYQEGMKVARPSDREINDVESSRVVRGGSWKTLEGNCRVACRFVATPKYRDDDGSFRLACSIESVLQTDIIHRKR